MAGLEMKYFTLNPNKQDDYGIASREALRIYAIAIRHENSQLADDLLNWVENLEESDSISFKEYRRVRTAAKALD